MSFQHASTWTSTVACTFMLACVIRLLWKRLVSHPLAAFPGPMLAAATEWYATYYEVWKDGSMVDKLGDLHRRYGPVVRVAPNQLHFNTPRAYADIYTNGTRFTKDPKLYLAFHQDDCSLTYTDPRDAKTRRDILAPMFSRKSILKLETVVARKVETLVQRVLSYEASRKPVNMHRAYRAATLDIILNYCFARDYAVVDSPNFTHFLILAYEHSLPLALVLKHFSWSFYFFIAMGEFLALFQSTPTIGTIFKEMAATINQLVARPELLDNEEHDTIFHHLLTPNPEKGQLTIPSNDSLLSEAINLIAAGSDTVGHASTVGTFYILDNPSVRDVLVAELRQAWPEKDIPMTYEALEKLPYLTAVIKESLRFSHGIVLPLPRIVEPEASIIDGHVVPRGTCVSMGSTFMHYNPDVFPDPFVFRPERWLQTGHDLDQYLVSFSKGPRSCLGQNLAWCELYLLFGHMFRKVDMALHDTTIADMAFRSHFTSTFRGKKLHCTVKAQE